MLKEEIGNMKKEVENVKYESKSFAFELLSELKKRAKRDFILHIIELIMILILGICLYISTYGIEYTDDYDTITQHQENTNNSSIIGEIN